MVWHLWTISFYVVPSQCHRSWHTLLTSFWWLPMVHILKSPAISRTPWPYPPWYVASSLNILLSYYVWPHLHPCWTSRTIPTPVFVPSLWDTLSLWNFPVAAVSLFPALSCCIPLSPIDCFALPTCFYHSTSKSSAFWLCFYIFSYWVFSQLQPLSDNDAHAHYIFREYLLSQWMGSTYETGISAH